jgi:hypothetical protein
MYIFRVGSDDSLAVGDFFSIVGASEGVIFVSTLYLSFSLTFPKPPVSRVVVCYICANRTRPKNYSYVRIRRL